MSRLALAAALVLSTCFAGCAACPKPAPVRLTGADYARVCLHPSMTAAAYREAFACQRPAYAGGGRELAGSRHDASSITPKRMPERSAVVASAVTGLE